MWVFKNVIKFYNYKNDEDLKDIIYINVNKMMFLYIKCININI